jgi:hypothetical protein
METKEKKRGGEGGGKILLSLITKKNIQKRK